MADLYTFYTPTPESFEEPELTEADYLLADEIAYAKQRLCEAWGHAVPRIEYSIVLTDDGESIRGAYQQWPYLPPGLRDEFDALPQAIYLLFAYPWDLLKQKLLSGETPYDCRKNSTIYEEIISKEVGITEVVEGLLEDGNAKSHIPLLAEAIERYLAIPVNVRLYSIFSANSDPCSDEEKANRHWLGYLSLIDQIVCCALFGQLMLPTLREYGASVSCVVQTPAQQETTPSIPLYGISQEALHAEFAILRKEVKGDIRETIASEASRRQTPGASQAKQLMPPPRNNVSSPPPNIFRRVGNTWEVYFEGKGSGGQKHQPGFQMIHYLLEHPGKEFFAIELSCTLEILKRYTSQGHRCSEQELSDLQEINEELNSYHSYRDTLEGYRSQYGNDEQVYRRFSADIQELETKRAMLNPKIDLIRIAQFDAEIVNLRKIRNKCEFQGKDKGSLKVIEQERARLKVIKQQKRLYASLEEHAPTLLGHFYTSIQIATICYYKPSQHIEWTLV